MEGRDGRSRTGSVQAACGASCALFFLCGVMAAAHLHAIHSCYSVLLCHQRRQEVTLHNHRNTAFPLFILPLLSFSSLRFPTLFSSSLPPSIITTISYSPIFSLPIPFLPTPLSSILVSYETKLLPSLKKHTTNKEIKSYRFSLLISCLSKKTLKTLRCDQHVQSIINILLLFIKHQQSLSTYLYHKQKQPSLILRKLGPINY